MRTVFVIGLLASIPAFADGKWDVKPETVRELFATCGPDGSTCSLASADPSEVEVELVLEGQVVQKDPKDWKALPAGTYRIRATRVLGVALKDGKLETKKIPPEIGFRTSNQRILLLPAVLPPSKVRVDFTDMKDGKGITVEWDPLRADGLARFVPVQPNETYLVSGYAEPLIDPLTGKEAERAWKKFKLSNNCPFPGPAVAAGIEVTTAAGETICIKITETPQRKTESAKRDLETSVPVGGARALIDSADAATTVALSQLADYIVQRGRSKALSVVQEQVLRVLCEQLKVRGEWADSGLSPGAKLFPEVCELLTALRIEDLAVAGIKLRDALKHDATRLGTDVLQHSLESAFSNDPTWLLLVERLRQPQLITELHDIGSAESARWQSLVNSTKIGELAAATKALVGDVPTATLTQTVESCDLKEIGTSMQHASFVEKTGTLPPKCDPTDLKRAFGTVGSLSLFIKAFAKVRPVLLDLNKLKLLDDACEKGSLAGVAALADLQVWTRDHRMDEALFDDDQARLALALASSGKCTEGFRKLLQRLRDDEPERIAKVVLHELPGLQSRLLDNLVNALIAATRISRAQSTATAQTMLKSGQLLLVRLAQSEFTENFTSKEALAKVCGLELAFATLGDCRGKRSCDSKTIQAHFGPEMSFYLVPPQACINARIEDWSSFVSRALEILDPDLTASPRLLFGTSVELALYVLDAIALALEIEAIEHLSIWADANGFKNTPRGELFVKLSQEKKQPVDALGNALYEAAARAHNLVIILHAGREMLTATAHESTQGIVSGAVTLLNCFVDKDVAASADRDPSGRCIPARREAVEKARQAVSLEMQARRGLGVLATLASVSEAPATDEKAREARNKQLGDLFDSMTDRSKRGGDGVISVGALAGGLWTGGNRWSGDHRADAVAPTQLSLPVGLGFDLLPGFFSGNCTSWWCRLWEVTAPSLGIFLHASILDLGQLAALEQDSSGNTGVKDVRLRNVVGVGASAGILIGKPELNLSVGIGYRYSPRFIDAPSGAEVALHRVGLFFGTSVPFLDLN